MFGIIKSTTEESILYPEEAVKSSIAACYFTLLWDLKAVQEKGESGVAGRDDIPNLHRKLNDYMTAMKYLVCNSSCHSYREEAYTSICDALVVFCYQLGNHRWMETLIYQPDAKLQDILNSFMKTNVFCDEKDEDLDEHARIELLHKMRNYLAQFCKLIVYNVLPTRAAADVFKYYVRYYNDYGDIIKATLGKAREINKVNCALTMKTSLTILFNDLPKVNDNDWLVDRSNEEFTALKDLAKRFALSFGLDSIKNRDAITALHREGILFAVNPLENPYDPTGPPPNLPFLEILSEFTNKLLKQDKRVVLKYLDSHVASATPSSQGAHCKNDINVTCWGSLFLKSYCLLIYYIFIILLGQPLYAYRNSLMHGETDQIPQTSKKAYTRKRQVADEEEDVHGHEEELEDDGPNDME